MNRRLIPNPSNELVGVSPAHNRGKRSVDLIESRPARKRVDRRRRPGPASNSITYAEEFYYLKQMNNRTPVVVTVNNGRQFRGMVEWYDRDTVWLMQESGSGVLLYKNSISHIHKQEEE